MAYHSKYSGVEVDALLDKIKDDNVGSIDSSLSTTSENPVQNKVITEELNKKVNETNIATINGQPLTNGGNIDVVTEAYDDTEINTKLTELANKIFAKITESFTSQSANVVQGYVVSNGDLADSSSYYRTLPIKVYGGETIVVSTKILSVSACGVAFYSSAEINRLNKIGDAYLVGAGTYENYEVVVPNQAQYVVISFAYNYNAKLTHLSETEAAFFTKEEIEKKVIIDSLDNESNINALSAKQGKLLNETKADIEFVSDKVQRKDTLPLVINATEGYWNASGIFVAESGRLSTEKFEVKGGTVIYISTYLGSTDIPMLVEYDADGGFIRYQKMGTGVADILVDYETTLHKNTCYVAINSARRTTTPSAYQIRYELEPKFYTKEETQGKLLYKKYGLRWKIDDYSDLGERMFDSVGLSAEIGIGATKGASDFDSIFPWSEMKRCNIKSNANGAKIVTYEGEDGFTLDGSNGDVFVRIPKFFVEKYQKDGYEYRVISEMGNLVHPLFVENGEILDEVYVSAFEGYIDNDKMRSIANVIPSNNRKPFVFLDAAKANGEGYTLYDSRCVDAIWTLFAVEFGCRNVSYIIGYGCSRFLQPVNGQYKTIQVAASATNTIKLENPNGKRNGIYDQMMVGTTITICKGGQSNILTQALITNVNLDSEYAEITFDGAPIDVDTTCFCGNAPQMTNWVETCNGALSWHTGRALRTGFNWGLESVAEKTLNPMRYRWIENINGNIWKFLPDITFNECQMYVCKNISEYEFHKTNGAYKPVHKTLTPQNINGGLNDKRIPNSDYTDGSSWIDKLIVEPFAKGISIGQSFTGNMLSSEGFGANYQLRNALVCIASGGGFDHDFRCNILTMRAQITKETIWYLYGARLMYKPM